MKALIQSALKHYREVIDEGLVKALVNGEQVVERRGIFSSALVVWLMIFQRLNSDHSLGAAIERLKSGDFDELLAQGSIVARHKRFSDSTGGYAKARKRVPLEVVKQTVDALSESLMEPGGEQRRFIVDGSVLLTAHSPENVKQYKRYKNQHGESHYPLIRTCVATDAMTGVVVRPSYAPYQGEDAVGEIGLAEELFERLPRGSIVMGDRLFGCPRFAAHAAAASHQVIVRVKEVNAKRYIGDSDTHSGEKDVVWESDRVHRGEPTEHYSVQGRFIWHRIARRGFRPFRLILFTNTDLPLQKVVEAYTSRWDVELDLRNLKSTLDMDMLYARSPELGAKELLLGVAAYNLVRRIMCASARILRVKPRDLSFKRTLQRIMAIGESPSGKMRLPTPAGQLQGLLLDVRGLLLPIRPRRKTEPRKIWPRGAKHTMKISREFERSRISKDGRQLCVQSVVLVYERKCGMPHKILRIPRFQFVRTRAIAWNAMAVIPQ